MRFVFILFLIAAVLAKGPITDLDVDTYRPYIESHTDVVVKYYTPVCYLNPISCSGAIIASVLSPSMKQSPRH